MIRLAILNTVQNNKRKDCNGMNTTEVLKCQFCGDSCGEEVCYSCQETAEDMGVDIDELYDMM